MKRSFLKLHIAILLAGLTGVLGRLITLDEGLLVLYRMGISSLAMFAIASLGRNLLMPARTDLLRLLGTGGIVALHWVLFYGSIKYANVSIALVCFSTVGFFTSILDPLITGRRWLIRELLLGCAVMLGIWLIFSFDAAFRTGILLGLVSSFMAALFTVLNKILLRHHTAESLTRWEMTGGWLLLTALLPFWLHWFPASRLVPTLSDLGWLLFLGLFCTVFAFRLSMDALKEISPFTVNLSYNLEPVYGILLAFLLFEENKYLGKGFLPGMLIILATVVIQTLLAWRERRPRG
ncbi:MAG: DMT family transporter [Chitinophagaceae bacterium]|nr:DMT family transporter [Chitinophagaceae bacterium]